MPPPVTDAEDKERITQMLQGCLARGIYLPPSHPLFLTLSHTPEIIEETLGVVAEAAAAVNQ